MLRLATAELRYNLASVLAWLSVLLVISLWPLVEAGGLNGVPSTLAIMMLGLPLVTPVSCFLLINVERSERRRRLWSMLPVAPGTVAGARLLRSAVLPLFAATLGILLVVLAAVSTGAEVFERLDGSWALGSLLLASFALAAFVTLLYDILGMAFAQVTSLFLVAATFVLNAFVPAFAAFTVQVTSFAQTPGGVVLMAVMWVLLVVADVQVFKGRGR